jgi:hypothetical protein
MSMRSVVTLAGVLSTVVLAAGPSSAQVSCSGVPAFANCTAYAAGASVVFNNTKYTALAAIPTTRDCPPSSPYTPSTDNWWTSNGACSGSATATATKAPTATATATTASRSTATATRTPTATSARATATATKAPTATATTSGSSGSCSGVAVFASCTAYASGAKVQYNGTLYQALSAISSARDCPPTSPNNPSNDNWWGNLGTCTGGTPTPTATQSGGGGATTGTINFHLLLGVSTAQDKIVLDGDNYTDLILSNMVAGVMYGHLVQEYYPGMQFQKDYLYGSILGQLLQENLATQYYQASSNLIDPTPDQQAVMGAGQGGPYQINNYVPDMVAPDSGHALINFVAVQKNIGFTLANAGSQNSQVTPPSFNNKYYGPVLTAYFHYNDFVALGLIGKGPGGWQTPWEPAYDNTLVTFKTLPNNFLDVVLNVAYNQGYYGPLMLKYTSLGATATASTVASVNSYTSTWGISDSYQQYPYQVRYYLDQLYDNPVPTTSATTMATPQNHVSFSVTLLGSVFSNVCQTLAYVNASGQYVYFSASQAQAAFSSALTQAGVTSATLDISKAADRAQMFSTLEHAIANLEASTNSKFNATTLTQL